jgi:hypothetical protein
MDAKISRTVKEWRAKRGMIGAATVESYMDSLKTGGKPQQMDDA